MQDCTTSLMFLCNKHAQCNLLLKDREMSVGQAWIDIEVSWKGCCCWMRKPDGHLVLWAKEENTSRNMWALCAAKLLFSKLRTDAIAQDGIGFWQEWYQMQLFQKFVNRTEHIGSDLFNSDSNTGLILCKATSVWTVVFMQLSSLSSSTSICRNSDERNDKHSFSGELSPWRVGFL